MRQVRDILERQSPRAVVGRGRELRLLERYVQPEGPVVTFVHGIPGIGKSALLQAFARRAANAGAHVVPLDGNEVEPSERGFLDHLGRRIDATRGSLPDVAAQLAAMERAPVLIVDTFERLRLLDSWFRRTFVPAIPERTRLVLASRYPPSSRWLTRPGWQDLVRPLRLGPLADEASFELLDGIGVDGRSARRIQEFARGHPLALKLGAVTAKEEREPAFGDGGISHVMHELSRLLLEEVRGAGTREALVAASAVRRTTVSVLSAIFPDRDALSLHEELAALPFVECGPDGLVVHEAVRAPIASDTRASDPERYRRYRRAAWEQLRSEAGTAGRSELWRYTADMLYLIENPICREAFFPSGAQELTVEPADEDRAGEVMEIAERHEGAEALDLLRYWWRVRRKFFRQVVDPAGSVVGFYLMLPADRARAAPQDPITAAWLEHLAGEGMDPAATLFIRRWLSREHGESPGPVQAACWLDMKRTYMEMRPDLRSTYLTLRDPAPYADAVSKMGFRPIPELERVIDGRAHQTVRLDFGPESVDGWLGRLAAVELGIEPEAPTLLDREARQAMADDERRVSLTPREFEVLEQLERRIGTAVSRRELLAAIWGEAEVASNVVDRIVCSLRRKLGEEGGRLETVRGFGYRLVRR